MRIFISYSRTDEMAAETLAVRLASEDHEIFWDRKSLPPGESFDDQLHAGIDNSELFICLIGEGSLDEGKYARTELKFAQQKWPNPSGNVLPVILHKQAVETLPSYLRAVTVFNPEGNMVAEVSALVREIANRPLRRLKFIGRGVAAMLVAALAGWFVYDTLTARPIELSAAMSGDNYAASVAGGDQMLRADTGFTRLLALGLSGEEHVDGEVLEHAIGEDEGAVGSLPLIHYRITNSTDAAIVIDRLRVSVSESKIDQNPLWWSSSMQRHTNCVINAGFHLGNEGWGDADNITYDFDLVTGLDQQAANCPGPKAGARCFSKTLAQVQSAQSTTVEFWDELGAFLPQPSEYLKDNQMAGTGSAEQFSQELDKLLNAVGGNQDGQLTAIGELSYDTGNGERQQFSFRQRLQIVQLGACVAPAMQALATYDIELRPEGTDYTVESPIAHSIDAGQTEAIDLTVWVTKSSIHNFSASIRVGDKWIEAPDALELQYYLPVHAEVFASPAETGK